MDVYCICGHCDAERSGQRRWTPATMVEVRQWPTFNYASVNLFLTKKQRKQLAEERRKGKGVRGTCSARLQEETTVTVVSNFAEDSAASFDIGYVSDPGMVRTQPMCVAKLQRRIVVDASYSSDLDPTASNRSCSSSSDDSDSSLRTNSDGSTSIATHHHQQQYWRAPRSRRTACGKVSPPWHPLQANYEG